MARLLWARHADLVSRAYVFAFEPGPQLTHLGVQGFCAGLLRSMPQPRLLRLLPGQPGTRPGFLLPHSAIRQESTPAPTTSKPRSFCGCAWKADT